VVVQGDAMVLSSSVNSLKVCVYLPALFLVCLSIYCSVLVGIVVEVR
jgi:hypothetical protein